MPKFKVLKGVAHNVGHSFTSLMNYIDNDYVMGHLLTRARQTGLDTLTIDFVRGEAGPPELLAPPLADVPKWYMNLFWDLVRRHGSDQSYVRAATLTLRYDIATQRPALWAPDMLESPYTCEVRITDIRGKEYKAHFADWWFPEPRARSSARWWRDLKRYLVNLLQRIKHGRD
ncbi:MAG TPA: hypothetical protein VNN18_10100 [Candidatus Xenobia bacterium]|nr:hypothetical protein [Candidatus Xenobia bacterium]